MLLLSSILTTTQQKLAYIMLKKLQHELGIVITLIIYNPQCQWLSMESLLFIDDEAFDMIDLIEEVTNVGE
jgi:hypothetical protein